MKRTAFLVLVSIALLVSSRSGSAALDLPSGGTVTLDKSQGDDWYIDSTYDFLVKVTYHWTHINGGPHQSTVTMAPHSRIDIGALVETNTVRIVSVTKWERIVNF